MNIKPLFVLIVGVLLGYIGLIPKELLQLNSTAIKIALLALFIAIGIEMGKDSKLWDSLKELKSSAIYISLVGLLGSMLGGALAHILTGIPLSTSVASAAGSGYYSITTLMLKEVGGPEQALIGFLSNLMRELMVIIGMPLIAKLWGKYGCVAAAGATAMDTSLPFIIKSVGKEIGILSFATGVILTLLVPFIVPGIYRILSSLGL